jgi:uncharacterized membrane protein YsdA (DUF1294 family)
MGYFIAFFISLNLITFAVFGIDKYSAIHNRRRIREKTLLYLAIVGGSIGAVAAQKLFRHKTQKFKGVMWLILLIHTAVFGMIAFKLHL